MANTTVKILHFSDVQLGCKFPQLGKEGDLVRNAIKDTFERTIKVALDEGVDGVIIAGNLFATNLVSRNLTDFAMKQIERLGRIPVVLVPGEYDALDETSLYKHLKLRRMPSNFRILGMQNKLVAEFRDNGFSVYGVPATSSSQQLPKVDSSAAGLQLLVLPDSVEGQDEGESRLSQLASQAAESSDFHYIAVGGSNGFRRWSDRVVSSGSPEAINFVGGESGRAILAEISEDAVNLSYREVGKMKWVDMEFNSDSYRFTLEVEREMQSHADMQTIMRARFTGKPNQDGFVDIPALKRSFRERFCHVIFEDERDIQPQMIHELHESSSSLVNEFTSLIREGYEQAPEDLQRAYLQALFTGRALLSGKDVM